MKKLRLILCFTLPLFILTGCWDRTEINDNAFVLATSVDKAPKEKYKVAIQIPLPSSMGGSGSSGGGGGTSGGGPISVLVGTGDNIRQSLEDVQARLSRKIFFGHRRVFIIGEDLAKHGIKEALLATFIHPQSRLSTFLVISKGEAVKMLQAQPKMEQFSGEAIREMSKTSLNMTAMDAMQDLSRPGKDIVAPVIESTGTTKKEKNGKEILMGSYALFNKDKMVFTTNKSESQGIMWLNEKMVKKPFSFQVLKNKEISVQIINSSIKPAFQIVNGKPSFDLKVRAIGILLENEPDLRIEDPKTYHLIIKKMEEMIKSNIKAVLDHAHSEGIDVYGFGWYLYRNHYHEWKNNWEEDWEKTLPTLKVNIHVDSDIQRTTNTGNIERK
ncbi:Ger(x)C family spore germination protein [Neobacillus dielmonensis]|uniref:Ger(x)C family spore germination protein n=1 Tax=Neobacillus dielmonensis TaxID=1347369 RepID=UPI0005A89EFC|nr:Ger(x)C family spore germination protein [Neobacillus dielmonensis]